jgi:hypothetical protein
MQLADRVERNCDGSVGGREAPRIPSFAAVTALHYCLVSTSQSRLCASLPIRPPSPNSQQPIR